MEGPSRRQFLAGAAAGIASTGLKLAVPPARNVPVSAFAPSYIQTAAGYVTDSSTQPVTSHLSDTWVTTTIAPESGKVLHEFELYFAITSKLHNVTDGYGIGGFFKLGFATTPAFGVQQDPRYIEIQPWMDGLSTAVFVDPTTPGKYGGWTYDNIMNKPTDPTVSTDADSGLVRIHGIRTEKGYQMEFSWKDTSETTDDQGITHRISKPWKESYLLPMPDLYAIIPGVRDKREFSGDPDFPSVFPYFTGIHHLNDIDASVAITKLSTTEGIDFEEAIIGIERSGAMYDAKIDLHPREPGDQKVLHVLWVDPNAHEVEFHNDIKVEIIGKGESWERLAIIGSDGDPISQFISDPRFHTPTPFQSEFYQRKNPFAFNVSLGELTASQDFAETIALVRATRELTWVAPSINGLSRCSEISLALHQVNQNMDAYPHIRHGSGSLPFTPVELATGCVELSDLNFTIYQGHYTGVGDKKKYISDAILYVQGDDLFLGKVELPREFDLSKPVHCFVDGTRDRVLGFVKEPYPVIDPLTPIICNPPELLV